MLGWLARQPDSHLGGGKSLAGLNGLESHVRFSRRDRVKHDAMYIRRRLFVRSSYELHESGAKM